MNSLHSGGRRDFRALLVILWVLAFGNSALAITIQAEAEAGTAKETDSGKLRLVTQPDKAVASVVATANKTTKSDSDPDANGCSDAKANLVIVGNKNKCQIFAPDERVVAEVPDFTDGNIHAGGKAEYKIRAGITNYGRATVRAHAKKTDAKKDGTGKATSIIDLDPPGEYVSLDPDGAKDDAALLLLVNPETSLPIFDDVGPSDSGRLSISSSVASSFFSGPVFRLEALVDQGIVLAHTVFVAPDWEIFRIEDYGMFLSNDDVRGSADLLASPLPFLDFLIDWNNYVLAQNSGGYGGASPFGAWFVYRDVPVSQRTAWSWESTFEGQVAVPELGSFALLALGLIGLAASRRYRVNRT